MALTQLVFAYNFSEIKLGGTGCSTFLPDSCDGQNTICPSGTCVCETGYYDSDGDGESGTCMASKYHKRPVQISSKDQIFIPDRKVGDIEMSLALSAACLSVHKRCLVLSIT